MIAAKSASSSSKLVSMMHAVSGSIERISRQTSTPVPSGSCTSNTATWGRVARIRATACAAVAASPTTSIPSASNKARKPCRTTSWSSTRNTDTESDIDVSVVHPSRLGTGTFGGRLVPPLRTKASSAP